MVPFFIHFGFCCKIWLKKVNLKNHSKWFHFSFILVLNILLQNLAKKSQLKKSFKMVPFFIHFGFCCKIWLKKINLKNHSKWFHFSFILVLNILLQNLAKKVNLKNHLKWLHFSFILVLNILLQNLLKNVNLKTHSKWFHFSFILVLNILLQNFANKSQLKKSFKMVPFFIHFGSPHFVAKFG